MEPTREMISAERARQTALGVSQYFIECAAQRASIGGSTPEEEMQHILKLQLIGSHTGRIG